MSEFKKANREWTTRRKKQIRKEIADLKKSVNKILREEADNPTAGKAHTFRAATYDQYMSDIKRLSDELESL